ncbi:MAG: transketolase family protein [Acidobacteriota bacterium]|nr:transketolase family protein [Acidobacteriota bacterium]
MARYGLAAVEACRLAQRELARRDRRFFSLEADSQDAGGFPFRDEFPDRYLAWTAGEASLIGAAGGLALAGKIPLVNTFSSFALIRACEQVRLDICYHQANAKIFGNMGNMGGIGGAEEGFSEPAHCSIGDLALARSMPNLTVIAPADAVAAYHATLAAGAHSGPVYIRLAQMARRAEVAENLTRQVYGLACPFEIGQGIVLRDGGDLTLVAAGWGVVAEALAAAELLRRDGVDARVIDLHTVKPVDRVLLARAAEETGLVITVEEHSVWGGLGGAVAEALGDEYPVPMRILGIRDACCHQVEPHAARLRRYGLDAPGIAACARQALARKGA